MVQVRIHEGFAASEIYKDHPQVCQESNYTTDVLKGQLVFCSVTAVAVPAPEVAPVRQ
jgi:hypothetical protein